MEKTVKCRIEANFTVESYLSENKKYLQISIFELWPEKMMSLNAITCLKEEIEEWDIYQDDVMKIDIDSLDEEKEYTGKFDVEIHYWSTYDNWSGATEYDAGIKLKCTEYKEDESRIFTGLEWDREYSKIFYAKGNKDGDFVFMKLLPSGRIKLEYAHCCVKHRGHFIDVTTLTACLAEHLHEYREKK